MAAPGWIPRKRKYEAEKKLLQLSGEETTNHPLKGIVVTVSDGKNKKGHASGTGTKSFDDPLSGALDGTDPLSMFAADPLSQMAAQLSITPSKDKSPSSPTLSEYDLEESFEPWSAKKAGILSKYTTSEKLSITTSFLSAADKEKVVVKSQATVTDKVKNRLEQLDDFEEGSVQEMLNLSQQEYVFRIEELNSALIIAWDQDQRVKALKIAIQCAKLLADISVIQFYPSKFVLITDILDTFGRLVFNRIKNKATYIPRGASVPVQLPDKFTPDQVPESAKETCRNWFFKIASIRELVPRFYVEAAILKCYSFLTTGEYNAALTRLGNMIRGIGDPLVSLYARCYLCRVGIVVAPKIKDHLMACFEDFLNTFPQIQGDSVQNILAMQKLELPRYLTLYSPALDWILQCIAHRAPEKTMIKTLERCKKDCNSALLLNSIMSAFKPEYIVFRAVEFTDMIRGCEETGFPKHLLYRSLGTCLVMADPPQEHTLIVLNEVWKVVMKLKQPGDYITCAEVWIEYVVKHFSAREINTILADIIKHMTPDRVYEDFYPQLQSVVAKVMIHMTDFSVLFSLDKFLPFIDMFQKDSVKVDVCKTIMEAYVKNQTDQTNDPVITNALMFICKTMHDSVNALTLDDEIRIIGNLINGFLRSISFGRDFEQQLSFYVESRAAFSNIDSVLIFLVQSVNQLAMGTCKIVGGNHTRKTAAFVRACAAYTFITIPSVNSVLSQLNLYLISGQVAILNQCLSQGDAFFKAAISVLAEVPRTFVMDGKVRSTEVYIVEFVNNFISSLLTIPDSPEQGVLYLLKGLVNVLQNYTWESHMDGKAMIYMNIVVLMSAGTQESFLHHVKNVDSNDKLYGCDPKYLYEVNGVMKTLLEEILHYIKSLDKPDTQKRHASLSFELFNRLISHADMSEPSVKALAVNLWNMSQLHGQLDNKHAARVLKCLKQKGTSPGGKHFLELASQLQLQTRT